MEPFKNVFNQQLVTHIATRFSNEFEQFNAEAFVETVMENFDGMELKARSNQIKQALTIHLSDDFINVSEGILRTLAIPSVEEKHAPIHQDKGLGGWAIMPIGDYVAEQGLSHIETSMKLLFELTMRFSSEFAIRPFLDAHPEAVLALLHQHCEHPNMHIRRLISEGTRPRLPWGMQLTKFVEDPLPVIELLEKLKDDEAEYVRRSVANNLNDIAKDHPDLVASIAKKWWPKADKRRQRLIRHGCRILLKEGHPSVLATLGFNPPKLHNTQLNLDQTSVRFGDAIGFGIVLSSASKQPQKLMIDFAVHHQKSNGSMMPKVFKWKTVTLQPSSTETLSKSHLFKAITTRKYCAGEHAIEVLVNGGSVGKTSFELVMD